MLFWVTLVGSVTRQLEFPPELPIFDHNQSVLPVEHEELRSDSELLKWDFRRHRVSPSSDIPLPEPGFLGQDLDKAPQASSDAVPGKFRIRVRFRQIEGGRREE